MSARRRVVQLHLAALGLFVSATPLEAATRTAANCSAAAVQATINAAKAGDLVVVPAGSCSWSSPVNIPTTKPITLQGAGMDATIVTGSGRVVLNLQQSGARVTGFGFSEATVQVDGDGWRIDHCRFTSANGLFEGVLVNGERENTHPSGVVDSCVFQNTRVLVSGWINLMASGLWTLPLNLGGANAVYVEDNVFSATQHSNAIDSNYGGAYVFRYNTVTDTYIEAHSVQGDHRATRRWEIYNNTFRQVSRAMWTPFFLRGGTGVVFNNTLAGTWGSPTITIDNVRTKEARGTAGMCDGKSRWDGNQEANGYPCRDQIGRSTDSWQWTSSRPYPPQQLDPAYFWNNTHNGTTMNVYVHNNAGIHIKAGRDFQNNMKKPGNTPYPYPHPLRQNK